MIQYGEVNVIDVTGHGNQFLFLGRFCGWEYN